MVLLMGSGEHENKLFVWVYQIEFLLCDHYFCGMTKFEQLQTIIKARRSVKPSLMNGTAIAEDLIDQLLELAHWAPTHARTEPWRFVVYHGDSLKDFAQQHADLVKQHTDPEKFTTAKYQGIIDNAAKASHVIVVYMKRQMPARIPLVEEIAATAAAVQNILLGAEALGLSVLWSTGGMTLHPSLKTLLELGEEDQVLGLLYVGNSTEPAPEPKRNGTWMEKVVKRY